MTPRPTAPLLAFAALAAGAEPTLAQDASIGFAERVEVWAYRTPGDAADRRDLFANDGVFLLDRISTVASGGAEIRFDDDTTVTIGRASDIVLDNFVYDPGSGAGNFVADVGRGAFRFVSGSIPNQDFRITTPTVTLGIRGTVFNLLVTASETRVDVIEGLVEVTPGCNPEPVAVAAGQSVLFRNQTCDTVVGVPTPIDALADIAEDAFPSDSPDPDFGDEPVPEPPQEGGEGQEG